MDEEESVPWVMGGYTFVWRERNAFAISNAMERRDDIDTCKERQ